MKGTELTMYFAGISNTSILTVPLGPLDPVPPPLPLARLLCRPVPLLSDLAPRQCPRAPRRTFTFELSNMPAAQKKPAIQYGPPAGDHLGIAAFTATLSIGLKVKQVEQISYGRAIERYIGVLFGHDGIRIVIATAAGKRFQSPVPFDELQDGNVVSVGMAHVAGTGVRGHDDHRNARAVAEEVQRLHVAGIVVAAAFVYR